MSLYDQYVASQKTSGIATASPYQKYLDSKVPKPSLVDQGVSAVKNYAQDTGDTVVPFGQKVIGAIQHPLKSLIDLGNFVSAPAKQGVMAGGEALYNLATDKGAANKVADTAHLISGTLGAAFSPITATFNLAEKTPGAKNVADVLGAPFTVAGLAGSFGTGKAVDWLPIPQESKDIIKQPLQEVGSTALQVILGGKIMGKIGDYAQKGIDITPDIAKKIVGEAKTEVAQTPPPKSLYEAYQAQKPVEAPKPTEAPHPLAAEAQKYSSAEEFVKARSDPLYEYNTLKNAYSTANKGKTEYLDAIKENIGSPKNARRGTSPISQLKPTEVFDSKNLGVKRVIKEIESGVRTPVVVDSGGSIMDGNHRYAAYKSLGINDIPVVGPKSFPMDYESPKYLTDFYNKVKGEGVPAETSTKVAKASTDINEKLVESGFNKLSPDEQAKYGPTTKAEQVHFVSRLMGDMERVKSMIRGEEPVPQHVLPQVLFNAAEEYATKNNDVALLQDLAKSPIATQLSEAAQTLGSHGYTDNPNSTVRVVQEIRKARATTAEKKGATVKKEVSDIKKEMKANATTRPTWEKFIEDITCGI